MTLWAANGQEMDGMKSLIIVNWKKEIVFVNGKIVTPDDQE